MNAWMDERTDEKEWLASSWSPEHAVEALLESGWRLEGGVGHP